MVSCVTAPSFAVARIDATKMAKGWALEEDQEETCGVNPRAQGGWEGNRAWAEAETKMAGAGNSLAELKIPGWCKHSESGTCSCLGWLLENGKDLNPK